jgi:hypothetical protein
MPHLRRGTVQSWRWSREHKTLWSLVRQDQYFCLVLIIVDWDSYLEQVDDPTRYVDGASPQRVNLYWFGEREGGDEEGEEELSIPGSINLGWWGRWPERLIQREVEALQKKAEPAVKTRRAVVCRSPRIAIGI